MTKNICGFDVKIVRKSIRNIHLKVSRNGEITLSMPRSCSINRAEKLIADKAEWIKKCVQNAQKRHPDEVEDGAELLIEGVVTKIVFVVGAKKFISDDGLTITVTAPQDKITIYAENYIKKRFLSYLQQRVRYFEQLTGLLSNGISVRKMRSKWGCCNIKTNKLTFSFYLAFKPLECIDYVVLHELVHTEIAAHDRLFYNRIEKFMPDYKARKKLLQEF